MALPKINAHPKYEMVIPSSKEKVRFRPFLVKEEKVLMIAMESNDTNQMLHSIVDTLDACIEDGVKKNKLTTFDVEYMFTKLRAKSVGETSKLGVNCEHCSEQNEVVINVEEIGITIPETDFMLDLGDNIIVEMQWPTYSTVVEMDLGGSETDQAFAIMRASLAAVHTGEERIDLKGETEAEIQDFLESMNRSQFEKLQNFISDMPALSHDVVFNCSKCEKENKQVLQGMQSFF